MPCNMAAAASSAPTQSGTGTAWSASISACVA